MDVDGNRNSNIVVDGMSTKDILRLKRTATIIGKKLHELKMETGEGREQIIFEWNANKTAIKSDDEIKAIQAKWDELKSRRASERAKLLKE